MNDINFLIFLILLGGIFLVLDAILIKIHKGLEREWRKLQEETKRDLDTIDGLIIKNIEILNDIHQARNDYSRHQGVISNKNFVKAHKSLFDQMPYDDFCNWLDQGSTDYIVEAIPYFEAAGLEDKVQIMRIYLERKFSE